MKALKSILLLCAALCFATSCKKEVDMTLVQKTLLENADIREIEVSNGWQVNVVADSCTYVELAYSAYLESYLNIKMEDTRLVLSFPKWKAISTFNSVFQATVHLRQLEKVDTKDASTITFIGTYEGEQLYVNLSEASVCNGLTFIGDKCEIEIDLASKLLDFQFDGATCTASLQKSSQFNGRIHAAELLDVELNNSRFINRGGETARADIKLQGGSLLNMVETQVNRLDAELSEASEATVWVAEYLRATLNDASTLYYKGNPLKDLACHDNSEVRPL